MNLLAPIVSRRVREQFKAAQARQVSWKGVPEAEWPDRQLSALQSVWEDAITDVPFYSALVHAGRAPARIASWRDFQTIPVLTRAMLQDQPHAFVRRSRPPQGFAKTAGSSGTPLQIGMDQAERDLMRVVKLGAWQDLGYTSESRVFLMWGHVHLLGTGWIGRVNHIRRWLADRALGYRRVNAYRLNAATCEAFAEDLIRFRPAAFISYASALDLFARYTGAYRSRFRALKLKFVLATTEPPPRPDTLDLLEDLFGCPVVQEYGGGEFGQVAFSSGRGGFTVYPDLNHVELDGRDSANPEAHALVVTALYSRYVPLIRYRIGDAVTSPRVLSNGHVAEFTEIAGRSNDVIQLSDGDHIHSLSIFHCVHQEPDVFSIQMALYDDRVELTLVAPGADREPLEARIRKRLAGVHPALTAATFVYADDIQTTRAGKRRWFVDQRSTPPCAASRES